MDSRPRLRRPRRPLFFFFLLSLLVLLAARSPAGLAQESLCCSMASGSCRSACSQVSLVALAAETADPSSMLSNVSKFCPIEMEEFWGCLNNTLSEMAAGAGWSGRMCCALPQAIGCRRACVTAASREALLPACRLSDELAFFACVDRQQAGEECCAKARSGDCADACQRVFRVHLTPSRDLRAAVSAACADHSPRVLSCVKNVTRVTPAVNTHKHLRCCEKTNVPDCRDTCRRILRTHTTNQEIVDGLEQGGCGPPLPHDSLWQCFLQTAEVSRIDLLGMDSAKMHCCSKASREYCRKLCIKTFSNDWTRSWDEFQKDCLTQLSEDRLMHCIDEVEEPCELGCNGLGYCTNFNNRPTELFRACTRQGDDTARLDVASWTQQGLLSLPGLGLQVPVRNISSCAPQHWQAVACAMQLRPCHPKTHTNRICREDCYDLLTQCVDWMRITREPSKYAAEVCSQLSPENPQTPCVSLHPFLQPSGQQYVPPQDEVTQPCRGNGPCNNTEVCIVNRKCMRGQLCRPYTCVPGCRVGEVSQYVVPQGTFVRLLQGSGAKDCPRVCQCGAHSTIERCQPVSCMFFDQCHLSNHQTIGHNIWFYIECNMCTCYAGEVTCTKHQCEDSSIVGQDSTYPSLPCKCPPHHVPVCGRNGNTYPSSCLARCSGLTDVDFEFGTCSSKDPCTQSSCSTGQKCIPARQVCLSLQFKGCPQYECVDVSNPCSSQLHEQVCDSDGEEHQNLCYLVKRGKTLAYRGPCVESCKLEGPVCGADGNTYVSECAAAAAYAPVDYAGSCIAVGYVSESATPQCSAAGVQCPPLPEEGCKGLTPPGACCPVCAGGLRVMYSHREVDRFLYSLKGRALSALTVGAVLAALEQQVQVAQCVVRGYLTVDTDLMVLVMADKNSASELQREACAREAEKLASLIQRTSPRMQSELSLSVLISANPMHVSVPASASCFLPLVTNTFIFILVSVLGNYHVVL